MYSTREGDAIPSIRRLNQYYDMNMSPVMVFQECPILLHDMHSGDQHILALNYLLHMLAHIAQDELFFTKKLKNMKKKKNLYAFTLKELVLVSTCNWHRLGTPQRQYDMLAEWMCKQRHSMVSSQPYPNF